MNKSDESRNTDRGNTRGKNIWQMGQMGRWDDLPLGKKERQGHDREKRGRAAMRSSHFDGGNGLQRKRRDVGRR